MRFLGHYIRDNRCFCYAAAGTRPVLEPHVKMRQIQVFLQLANGQSAPFWGLSLWRIIYQSSPFERKLLTTLQLTVTLLQFPHFSFYLESLPGFSLQCCLEQREAVPQCPSGSSLPPSGQEGGLKIPTKCSRIYFCAIKRLQSKQISFFLVPVMHITYRLWQHHELLLVTEVYSTQNLKDFPRSDARWGMDRLP